LLILLFGLVGGLLFGLLNGFSYAQEIERGPIDRTRWSWWRIRERILTGINNGLLVGLLVGMPYGLSLGQRLGDVPEWIFALEVISVLLGGFGFVLIDRLLDVQATDIQPAETFGWSWARMGRNLVKFLFFGLLASLVGILLIGLYLWMIGGTKDIRTALPEILHQELSFAVIIALSLASIGGLLGGLTGGVSNDLLNEHSRIQPNQGMYSSARHSLLVGIIGGMVGVGVGGALSRVINMGVQDPDISWFLAVRYGLFLGPLIGLVSGLRAGGIACIQHIVLRWLLHKTDCLPWNCTRFLDYASERILLHKVGGGYIFVHRLILEYFATLERREAFQ
jgi:hypothetical protein